MTDSPKEALKHTLRNLATLRYLAPGFSDHLYFIFGCQRSGTTLLLSILNAHPKITGTDETEFPSPYPFPSAPRLAINSMTKQYACFKMLEHSHKVTFLKQFYPQAKVLWPIRNPHSTISSMLKLSNSEGTWIDRCADAELERLKPFFPEQLTKARLSERSQLEKAALYWTYKNQYPAILQSHGFDVFPFKYEDLLQNPTETLTQIVSFLGIEWSDDLLKFHQKNPSKLLAGGTHTNNPINAERASKLLADLNAAEVASINEICAPVMNTYGYPMVLREPTREPNKVPQKV